MKRLQLNVSNKLKSDEIRLNSKIIENSTRNITTGTENDSGPHKNSRNKNGGNPESISETEKFKEEVNSIALDDGILTTVPRVNTKTHHQPFLPKGSMFLKPKPVAHPKTPQPLNLKQHQLDDSEAILAKITSSQRSICTVIDSLV